MSDAGRRVVSGSERTRPSEAMPAPAFAWPPPPEDLDAIQVVALEPEVPLHVAALAPPRVDPVPTDRHTLLPDSVDVDAVFAEASAVPAPIAALAATPGRPVNASPPEQPAAETPPRPRTRFGPRRAPVREPRLLLSAAYPRSRAGAWRWVATSLLLGVTLIALSGWRPVLGDLGWFTRRAAESPGPMAANRSTQGPRADGRSADARDGSEPEVATPAVTYAVEPPAREPAATRDVSGPTSPPEAPTVRATATTGATQTPVRRVTDVAEAPPQPAVPPSPAPVIPHAAVTSAPDTGSAPPLTGTRVSPPLPSVAVESSPPPITSPQAEPNPRIPAGEADANTAAAGPPAAQDEEAAVRSVLSSYRAAYASLDAAAARRVWPGVDERALARAFSTLRSQQLQFDRCSIEVRGDSAVASCVGRAEFVQRVGRQDPQVEPRRWTFTLSQAPTGWRIAEARTER